MMRLAEAVARKSHASALVTGESLGQVASQTIKALGVTEDVTKMPVLRPLIGTDKVEIILHGPGDRHLRDLHSAL